MLVLTRRIGETVVIDGVISITVLEIRGDKTRLGISAPPSICVDRAEIHERRQVIGPEGLRGRRALVIEARKE